MNEKREEILFADEILDQKVYRKYFKNNLRILNSFIINNHHLFQIDESGKLYIKKSVLDKAINLITSARSRIN